MRSAVIHRSKLLGGRMTAREVHAAFAFPPDAKCSGCGRRPTIRAIVLAPLDEALKHGMVPIEGEEVDVGAAIAPALVPVRESASAQLPKQYVRISKAYSCDSCRPEMEKALAKAPSWCIVDINRGPAPEKIIASG